MEKIDLIGFNDLPDNISAQIQNAVDVWKAHIRDKLIGVYLHGSIALGAFCSDVSDIDLLIVIDTDLSPEKRVEIAADIIKLNASPCPLEISAVKLDDLKNWKDPGKCAFHYSSFWTESYLKRMEDPNAYCLIADSDFPDRDVTSHIRLIKEHGITLYGCEINDIFPTISDEEFWSAISYDIEGYDFYAYDMRCLVGNILTLGRILSFKREKKILSKYEAGIRMFEYLPQNLKYIPQKALKVRFLNEECSETDFPEEDLEAVRELLIKEILK